MVWTKRKSAALAAALGVAALAPAVQAGVVVSSSGPSAGQYPVGRQIADNATITLRAGDVVTVLQNGGTRVLRGGAGPVVLSQGSGATNPAFASLTGNRTARRARTGAVRTGDMGPVRNPNLWYVDVGKAGTVCLAGGDNLRLWRADTQAASTYAVSGGGAGGMTVTFPAGEMLAAWDIDHPPVAGQTYRIGHGSGSTAVDVRFVFLDTVPTVPEELAATLASNGCTLQLQQMADASLIAQ